MNSKLLFFCASLLVITAVNLPFHLNVAQASGHETGHGGTDVGVEFDGAFFDALRNLKQSDSVLYQSFVTDDFLAIFKKAVVLSTDDDLKVEINGVNQSSVAANDQTTTILVNTARWKAIQNAHVQEALALHEVLSLAKLEDTGRYLISGEYLALFSLPQDILPTGFTPARALVVAGAVASTCADNPFGGDGHCHQKLLQNTLYVGEGLTHDEAQTSAIGQCIQGSGKDQGACAVLVQQMVFGIPSYNSWYDVAAIDKGCLVIAVHREANSPLDGVFGVGASSTLVESELVALGAIDQQGEILFSRCLR